ncbi:MAG: methylmalonyl-CoA epimerase [bacterium]|nr:methylmalonyl-CoA epimerase [bacterium]
MTHDQQGILAGLPAGTAGHVDHIGIAVPDLEQALVLYRDLLGLELERIEEVPQENVRVAFLKLDRQGGPGHLELLAPMSEAGAIAAFIAKRGPGLHHVAVAAVDVPAVLERCRAAGLALIDQEPRCGAGGKQIAFVHPCGTGGVLLEICGPGPA